MEAFVSWLENNGHLQQKDAKDGYTAIKNGYDERYKIAEVKNCNYTSFAFSSFESTKEVEPGIIHFCGEVEKGNGIQTQAIGIPVFGNIKPHTGKYMVKVAAGQVGPIFKAAVKNVTINGEDFERGLQAGRTYIASVWVHKSNLTAKLSVKIDGAITTPQVSAPYSDMKSMIASSSDALQIGEWKQLNVVIEVPENYVSSGGGGTNDLRVELSSGTGLSYFDDLVFHPVDAQFTGYVMDKRLGLVMSVINNENFYTRFKYDNAGNLVATYKETANGEKVISTNKYQYK